MENYGNYMLTPYFKPPFPHDRPLSHSQLSSFEYSPGRWYRQYVLGVKDEPSPELLFGSMVDKKIQEEPTYLPQIVRLPLMQYELRSEVDGISLIGYPDQLNLEQPELRDTKSGRVKWTRKRTDETKQLTHYLLQIYLNHKIPPESFRLFIDWLPTHYVDNKIELVDGGNIVTFETKRTMLDLLKYIEYIKETRRKMFDFYNKQ